MAASLYEVFKANPNDKRLHAHRLHNPGTGKHRKNSIAVSITLRYRAIYVVDHGIDGRSEPEVCWYWVGSHEEYNTFVGS